MILNHTHQKQFQKSSSCILLLVLVFLPILGFAQNQLPNEFKTEVKQRIRKGINNGIAIATIDSLGTVTYHNFGLENEQTLITERSTFEIASISKTFTSTLFTQLEKTGYITLNQEIRKYLPDSLPEPLKQITFHQLINHTSGLPRLPPDYWCTNWDNPYADHNKQKFITSLMKIRLDTIKSWNYSNLGYALLGLIADEITLGKSLEIMISDIGLGETSSKVLSQTSATPHNFGIPVEGWDFPYFNRYVGGVKSSSADMTNYLLYQIKHNRAFSKTPFNQCVIINDEDSLVCNNGWLVFHKNKQQIIWHNGISGGFNSFIGYNIHTKTGVVLLSNAQSSITDLGLHYLSKTFPLHKSKPSLAVKIEALISSSKLDSVQVMWSKPDTTNFKKNAIDLHWLQCHYIAIKNPEIALMLNGLLLEEYANDWEVFYYRAKIYTLTKNYTSAKEMYEKAHTLFPENTFTEALINALPRH